jgi:hypothetical protein
MKMNGRPVGDEIAHAQGSYLAWINGGAYNEEICGCSSAEVQRSIPAFHVSIGAVATPVVALPGNCSALIRDGSS